MEEIVRIGESLTLSAREDCKCMIQREYHTILDTLKADGKLNENAVQSYRNYLMDGSFSVLLTFTQNEIHEKVRDSLLNPSWPIFLGRKACPPTLPIYWGEEPEEENAKEVFSRLETVPQIKARLLNIKPKKNLGFRKMPKKKISPALRKKI